MATTTYLRPQSLTTELVEAAWDEILQGIKARDRTLFVLLTSSGGVRLSVKGDQVTIHVKSEWQVKRIIPTGPKRVIESSINQYFGSSITITATCNELDTLNIALDFFNLRREQWILSNEEELRDEIVHLREVIKIKNRHHKALEKQSAKFDIHVPTHIILSIEDIQEDIRVADERINEIKYDMIATRFKYINPGETAGLQVNIRQTDIKNRATSLRQDFETVSELKEKIDKHVTAVEKLHALIEKIQESKDLTTTEIGLDLLSTESHKLAEEIKLLSDNIRQSKYFRKGPVFYSNVEKRLQDLKSDLSMSEAEAADVEKLH